MVLIQEFLIDFLRRVNSRASTVATQALGSYLSNLYRMSLSADIIEPHESKEKPQRIEDPRIKNIGLLPVLLAQYYEMEPTRPIEVNQFS
jgi:hypothetical protein